MELCFCAYRLMCSNAFLCPYWKENDSPELFVIQLIQSRGWLKMWLLFISNIYMALMRQELYICVFITTPAEVIGDFEPSRSFPKFWIQLMVKPWSLRSSWTQSHCSAPAYWLRLCEVYNLGKGTNTSLVLHLCKVVRDLHLAIERALYGVWWHQRDTWSTFCPHYTKICS